MSDLIKIFEKLNEYLEINFVWEEIEEILENVNQNKVGLQTGNMDGPHDQARMQFIGIPLVQRACLDDQISSILMELCATIRRLRGETESSYDNTFDCWDQVVKVAHRDGYLAFIFILAALIQIDCTSLIYIKLSILAVNTYFLSLTIPGAKGFHIFEEEVIKHCLQVFGLIERIQNPKVLSQMKGNEPIQIWLQFTTLCDDLKLVLRYVHFSDHKEARDVILKKLIDIQYLNHEKGYANTYAANLHTKCFEIYEEMINAHNGDPEQTLVKLMNMTVFLHTYPSKPKTNNQTMNCSCEHISDWFIKSISKYPRLLVKVLTFYIEWVVTNPLKTWKTEQTQKALEYAAKYDSALFTKCNESCVEFICDAIYAEEVMIRSRAIDLMSKILQLESQVDWQMFRHEVSDIPREIHLIKELINSLKDQNNNIKLKSVQALHIALTKGSPTTRKILYECVKYAQFCDTNVNLPEAPRVRKNEIRFEKPNTKDPEYTFQGYGILLLPILNLPSNIYLQIYQNPLSYIRRAGIMFMEQLVKLNPLILFNTHFVEETSRLVEEPTALVRKQTLLSIDSILESYPNCYPVIWIWCKVISPMLHDSDAKNIEVAIECFRSRVLMNMKSIEQTNKAEHFMPWVIIRTLLSTQSRFYLQNCFNLSLQHRMISSQIVSIIESHLLTSNSTEAWVALNFICDKVKSSEPDALIHHFISLESWNKEQNMLIALEVLANCIKDFSHTALNLAFNHLLTQIKEGKMLPIIIGKAFDFLLLIDNRSQDTGRTKGGITQHQQGYEISWVIKLHQHLEVEILTCMVDFPENRHIFMSYLFAYSEVNLQTRIRPHQTIISFIQKYINECTKIKEVDMHLENERLFNSMIVIAGRLALRDSSVATTTCSLYVNILNKYDHPPIVNTIIVALTDLCKKHTQIVERIVDKVLRKLKSPYEVNRMETFKCFEKLVLQDQLKLRGSLLLALLATLLDESKDLAARAEDFFLEFVTKKNPALFQKCLIECPYVFNEYKNFDGLDNFAEACIKSPLKGESQRKFRQQLYSHFMSDMDNITMILYFGQLKLIAEKSKTDPLIQTAEGTALVKDVLFILKKVCQLTKEQKLNTENSEADKKDDDNVLAEINELTDDTSERCNKKVTNKTGCDTGAGRGKRKREVTMPEAITILEKSLIFIPTIYKSIHNYDASIEKSFDELCRALAKRFTNLIDYAQPVDFWDKYRSPKVTNNTKCKKKIKERKSKSMKDKDTDTDDEVDEECEGDDDIESDDEEYAKPNQKVSSGEPILYDDDGDGEPLLKHSKRNNVTFAEPSMDYIFKPNI